MLNAKSLFHCMCLMSGGFPRLLLPGNLDAIFIWGRATDEWQSTRLDDGVLKVAADLHRLTGSPVAIPGYVGSKMGQGDTGYPGPMVWRDALKTLGVPNNKVFPTDGAGNNTKTEMDDYIKLALGEEWINTIAVTQPSHALRAMLGTVASLEKLQRLDLKIVPTWSANFDWNYTCYGSQGDGPFERTEWIGEEYGRIPRYQNQNDLATLEELCQYLFRIHVHMRRHDLK